MTSQDLFYIKKHGWRSWTEKLQRSRAWGPDIEELASFRYRYFINKKRAVMLPSPNQSRGIVLQAGLCEPLGAVGGQYYLSFSMFRARCAPLKRETKVICDKSNVGHFRLSQFGIMLHSRKFNTFLESCHLTIAPEYILHKARSHPTLKNMFVEHSSLINPRSN
jgi:hypothetical protein